ncbi:MAG: peptidoglycan-binding protein, partial [Eubacteriales bacterium]
YCDGVEVQCPGLSQWGSVALAEQGLTPYEILQYYFGDNIDIVRNVPVEGIPESYGGVPLRLGAVGNDVRLLQIRLNRISRNYPGIPKISVEDGYFDAETRDAVQAFQRQFSLTPDGVVGPATWYAIARIYNGVRKITDINAEGIPPEDVTLLYSTELREGSTGAGVTELQYFLAMIAAFNPSVRPVAIDGVFGPNTRAAVEDFQYDYGLPVTGVVEMETWKALYNTYRNLLASLPEGYFSVTTEPYPGVPLVVGEENESVRVLQTYLNRISDVYPEIPKVTVDGVYGLETEAAVRAYQELFGLTPGGDVGAIGTVGARTWNSIAGTYRSLVQGEEGPSTQFGGEIS